VKGSNVPAAVGKSMPQLKQVESGQQGERAGARLKQFNQGGMPIRYVSFELRPEPVQPAAPLGHVY